MKVLRLGILVILVLGIAALVILNEVRVQNDPCVLMDRLQGKTWLSQISTRLRISAAKRLSELREPAAVGALVNVIRVIGPEEKEAVLKSTDPGAVKLARKYSLRPLRVNATAALGNIAIAHPDNPAAIDALISLASSHKDFWVQHNAILALARFDSPRIHERLIPALISPHSGNGPALLRSLYRSAQAAGRPIPNARSDESQIVNEALNAFREMDPSGYETYEWDDESRDVPFRFQGRVVLADFSGTNATSGPGRSGEPIEFPPEYRANAMDRTLVVAVLTNFWVWEIGRYQDNSAAYRSTVDIVLVDWPQQTVLGLVKTVSDMPARATLMGANAEKGTRARQTAAIWLARMFERRFL
jgi:hypothetical protein